MDVTSFTVQKGANSWRQVLVCCMQLKLMGHAARLIY